MECQVEMDLRVLGVTTFLTLDYLTMHAESAMAMEVRARAVTTFLTLDCLWIYVEYAEAMEVHATEAMTTMKQHVLQTLNVEMDIVILTPQPPERVSHVPMS